MGDYFDSPGVNWSTLKWMRESPLAYQHAINAPRVDSPAYAMGRLVHSLVFEPDTVHAAYAVWDGGRRAGKDWEAFVDEHDGRTIVKADEYEAACAMSSAVINHPLVAPLLDGGEFEQPLHWVDSDTGLLCKARPDWLVRTHIQQTLIDLKTTATIDGRRFGSMAARYGYHCQLAHYRNGVREALGWEPKRVLIVAVEKTKPNDVAVFELTEDDLWAGHAEVCELLQRLKQCQQSGHWPGRYAEIQALQLPAWVTMDDDADADGFGLIVGE